MSAPDSDPEKQVRQHRGALYGMALVVVLALAGLVWWLFYEVDGSVQDKEGARDIGAPAAPASSP